MYFVSLFQIETLHVATQGNFSSTILLSARVCKLHDSQTLSMAQIHIFTCLANMAIAIAAAILIAILVVTLIAILIIKP